MTQTPVKVLLIEDDNDDYLLTRNLLQKALGARHHLDWAADFEQGFAIIAEARHDVYLIDYRLGPREGIDLIPSPEAGHQRAPFIMLTGQDDHETDMQAMQRGAADYLLKSTLTPQSLERAIRHAVTRFAAETALRKNELQQRAILDNIDEAVYLIARDADGSWQTTPSFISGALERLIGYTPGEFIADPEILFRIIHPDDATAIGPRLLARRNVKAASTLQYRALHKHTGQLRWIEDKILPQFDNTGAVTTLIGIVRDITQRKAAHDRLFHAAFHDRLTGLPNRSLFMDRLANAIGRGKRSGNQHWAVLFIDLDRFKSINDNLGHDVGDKVLISTVHRVKCCLRAGDTLARLGGDEFITLLDGIATAEDAYRVSARIHEALTPPHIIAGREVFCSASIGIATGKPGYQQPEEVLRHADTAMYRAKADGQARARLFETGMHMRLNPSMQAEIELKQALEGDELVLYYQPIVALEGHGIHSLEALLRWRHPVRGVLAPGEFMAIAEKSGLAVPIGKWMLRGACQQMRTWKRAGLRLSLNSVRVKLSARQLTQADLADFLGRVLAENGLEGQYLHLECAESAFVGHDAFALNMLEQLKSMDIRLSVGDSGASNTLPNNLHSLPIDAFKIGDDFIKQLNASNRHKEIVRGVIEMAHRLDMTVFAAGVETATQADLLTTLRCDFGQGNYFSPPMDAEQATALLSATLANDHTHENRPMLKISAQAAGER